MSNLDIIMPLPTTAATPTVRSIGLTDIRQALAQGYDDFIAMPTHVPFLILIYPVVGILLASATFDQRMIPLLYPIATGMTLIGPLTAIWLFELSRRRELGRDTSWRHALDIVHSPSLPAITGICLLLLATFFLWIISAQAIYNFNFGTRRIATASEFVSLILNTREGHNIILYGNLAGCFFAIVAATLSVTSLPLLVDRNVGFSQAISTSFNVVARNPIPMAAWGLVIALALLLGSIPFFIGLAVVFPVLGHATWHLYTKVIAPDPTPHPKYIPASKGRRYAADFPASLFSRSRDEEA